MMKKEEVYLHNLCNLAYKLAEDMAMKYASVKTVDDFETFMFLAYLFKINELNINKLEERINELEQKQEARNNA